MIIQYIVRTVIIQYVLRTVIIQYVVRTVLSQYVVRSDITVRSMYCCIVYVPMHVTYRRRSNYASFLSYIMGTRCCELSVPNLQKQYRWY